MNETMKMQKLDFNKHDTFKVAELIYETDANLFNFFFKNKENTAHKIEKLVRSGNNTLGHERIKVVTPAASDEVQGIMVYSCGPESEKMDEMKILRQNFNWWDVIKFSLMEWWDNHFLADLNKSDFYLACVAVDELARGKGIGSFILEESCLIAKNNGFERVVLDVDLDNKGAYRLYQKMGFKVFNKNRIPWFGGEKGVLNMEYML